jgi:hypothetical protein
MFFIVQVDFLVAERWQAFTKFISNLGNGTLNASGGSTGEFDEFIDGIFQLGSSDNYADRRCRHYGVFTPWGKCQWFA